MRISDPLHINNWEIHKFIYVILATQLAMWGLIGLDFIDLQIPLLRQIIGFIYLTFVPGVLILRILKLHKLKGIEVLSYSVGLSLATLMFIGLIINITYPLVGIYKPISLIPLTITIGVVVLIFCILSYVRDNDYVETSCISLEEMLSPPTILLLLIPFLAIFGTYLINICRNYIISMILIVLIAIVTLLIGFDRFIPEKLYPLGIFVIAISLLYHKSLISMFLIELGDISFEYWISKTTVMNSVWDPTIYSNLSAMLSLVMLVPIYSIILELDITWVYKIICPFFYSLVPLVLYQIYLTMLDFDKKSAFLSCFFYMSMFAFYGVMLGAVRQQIALLFMALLIPIMITKSMDRKTACILFIVFSVSLITSHYGITYLYLFALIAALLILLSVPKLFNYAQSNNCLATNSDIVFLFLIFTLAWYMYTSSSSTFDSFVRIGNHIYGSIFTDIFDDPKSTQALDIIVKPSETFIGFIYKTFHLATQLFIAVGISTSLFGSNFDTQRSKFTYLALSIPFFGMCLAGILIPYFASALNTSRLFHITLIFLAPFCIVGGISALKAFCKIMGASWTNKKAKLSLRILYIMFVIYFFFNSGFINELANQPVTFSLNASATSPPNFNEKEITAAKWLKYNMYPDKKVYSDCYNGYLLMMSIGSFYILSFQLLHDTGELLVTLNDDVDYFFLGRDNVVLGNIWLTNYENPRLDNRLMSLQNLTIYDDLLNMSQLYDNGESMVIYNQWR